MNKVCSIFIDNLNPIEPKIIKYLRDKYELVYLVGSEVTTKYHIDLPYVYYGYIKYLDNIDIVFQNLKDIEKMHFVSNNIGYIYDCEKHNISYNILHNLLNRVDYILVDNISIPHQLFVDVFEFQKDIIYV